MQMCKRRVVVTGVGFDAQRRIGLQEHAGARLKRSGGDVNRAIAQLRLPLEDRFDEMARLDGAAAAEFEQRDLIRTDGGDDLVCVAREDFVFGARQVILRQQTDRVEEERAEFVVKIFGEELFGLRREAAAHVCGEEGAGVAGQELMRAPTRSRSLTLRAKPTCTRVRASAFAPLSGISRTSACSRLTGCCKNSRASQRPTRATNASSIRSRRRAKRRKIYPHSARWKTI